MVIFQGKNNDIGELVWIPASTPLMYCSPQEDYEFLYRPIEKKEPVYGLILSEENNVYHVLVGENRYYVEKKLVYGAKNDY